MSIYVIICNVVINVFLMVVAYNLAQKYNSQATSKHKRTYTASQQVIDEIRHEVTNIEWLLGHPDTPQPEIYELRGQRKAYLQAINYLQDARDKEM